MKRRPTTQDITWLLDLHHNKQLDLDPPYQRRSVWTMKDKQFFIDTIFRNFPSPAIFLHKTISAEGKATYHVVDGKQRTQTILDFVENKVRVSSEYGDIRLDSKKWGDLESELSLKQNFWNYQLTVEMIDIVEGSIVNEVFDRLNRNSRKLSRQELRHAKYDGWLVTEAETEAAREEWKKLGILTTARAKRMLDVQSLSELMFLILEGKVIGFDQDHLDDLYAKYDDISADSFEDFDADEYTSNFTRAKNYVFALNAAVDDKAAKQMKVFNNLYTVWAWVALADSVPTVEAIAPKYSAFMEKVEALADQENLEEFLRGGAAGEYQLALKYLTNSRGASTDLAQRKERLEALTATLGA